jgi:general secretion pathway protein G
MANRIFSASFPHSRICGPQRGFTLVELMIAVAVVGILASVAISSYAGYMERVRVAQAKVDIVTISAQIEQYYTNAHNYPPSLSDLGTVPVDPWGRPYVYVDLTALNGNGMARRDRSLNPLNSDFDLYSVGKDGVTKKQISQRDSLDDVLRANDGRFVDLASKF